MRFECLLRGACAEFGATISAAERRLIRASVVGEVADFNTPEYVTELHKVVEAETHAIRNDEELPGRPPPPVVIRASLITWLLTSGCAKKNVHPHGIRMEGVFIEDTLRLANTTLHGPLWIVNSLLESGCDFTAARCHQINLDRSRVHSGMMTRQGQAAINLDDANCAGRVQLRDGFLAQGTVRLVGARLSGLECNGRFFCPGGMALVVDVARVRGNVFFSNSEGDSLDGCEVVGEARMASAEIDGDVYCTGARFRNGSGTALMFQGAHIAGMLVLRDIVEIKGIVDLTKCRIGFLVDGKQRVSGSDWPKNICLIDCRYDAIYAGVPLDAASRLRWLDHHDDTFRTVTNEDLIDPQPYRLLADVMRKQGHEEDARTVLRVCAERRVKGLVSQAFKMPVGSTYRYLVRRAGVLAVLCIAMLAGGYLVGAIVLAIVASWFAWQSYKTRDDDEARLRVCQRVEGNRVRLMQNLYRWSVGHGYARWRVLLWLGLVLSVGTLLFIDDSMPHPGGLMQPTQSYALKEWSQGTQPAWYDALPKYNPLLYSADALIPLVSFHQEEHWTPSASTPRGWFVKNVYLPVHISAGWVIATLFVASFTRLMRQEG